MPLLLDNNIVTDDKWSFSEDAELGEGTGPIDTPSDTPSKHTVVSFKHFPELIKRGQSLPKGVSLAPDDDVYALAPFIESLELVCIEFPVFTDGRGYSHARIIRKRFGYTGELRATGDIRADQMLFMNRVGINAFESDGLPEAALLKQVLTQFDFNYQPSYPLP